MVQNDGCGKGSQDGAVPVVGEGACRYEPLGHVPAMVLIYGLMATVVGIVLECVAIINFDEMWLEITGPDGLFEGLITSEEGFVIATVSMSFILLSGVLALVSAQLIRRRVRNRLAVVLCVISSLLLLVYMVISLSVALLTLLLVAVGLYMAFRVHRARSEFISRV